MVQHCSTPIMGSGFEFDWWAAVIKILVKINQLYAQVGRDIASGKAQSDR